MFSFYSVQDVLLFWLKQGVDGFRVDAIRHLYEEKDLTKNEPQSFRDKTTPVCIIFGLATTPLEVYSFSEC